MRHTISLIFLTLSILSSGCDGGNGEATDPSPATHPPAERGDIFIPAPEATFSIVLDGRLPEHFEAEVVDLDAFETTPGQIAALHAAGKRVFAYLSVGSWEPYREDAGAFPPEIIGKVYPGWEDEKFLDIRATDRLMPLIRKRFDMIAAKGFDGIEADNIDIYGVDEDGANATGFGLTIEDIKRYVDVLIAEAHARGLSIGQKNAPELVQRYGDLFDWALLEDPFFENYAEAFSIYTEHNKAVFALSYTDNTSRETFLTQVCKEAASLRFMAILKDRDLGAAETTCPK